MSEHTGDLNGQVPDTGNVETIRDILFGTQMRDYDRRFATVEERLLRESSTLRDDMGRRLLATEQYLRAELESLTGSLKAEERDRLQGLREVADAMSANQRELSDRLSALTEQAATQQREMRAQLQEAQRVLGEEVQRRYAELADSLRREALALRVAKTDRTELAAMFAEFAQRLTAENATR